jgi:two-component system chemotaxis response regulator CheB
LAKRDIVAIGGSAGSTQALKEIVRGLPADFPGSVFIATHTPSAYRSRLPDVLAPISALPVVRAVDGMPVEPGRIYTAVEDRHLLVLDSTVRLGVGPRENLTRPAIDPLFRSVALSFGPRAVGVVLSGLLNDGASGLHAIKAAGGAAVVQNPLDAAEDEMPRAAMAAADHLAAADRIAGILCDLAGEDAPAGKSPPESLLLEVEIANGAPLGSDLLRRMADPAPITCPENARIDHALRVALRIVEERAELVERMAQDARASGRALSAEQYEARAVEHRRSAAVLREAALRTLRASQEIPEPAD